MGFTECLLGPGTVLNTVQAPPCSPPPGPSVNIPVYKERKCGSERVRDFPESQSQRMGAAGV